MLSNESYASMNTNKVSPNTAKTRKDTSIDTSRKTRCRVFRLCSFPDSRHCHFDRMLLTAALLFSLLSPANAKAASFNITSSTTLSPVVFTELGLSGTGTANNEGNYDASVTWGGVVSSPLTSLDQVYTGSTVQRTDVLLWYYQFNKSTESQPTFTPTYRIFSKTGNIENKLSHSSSTSNTVNASITAQPIVTSKYSGNTYRCYGYATITVDLTTARRSGTYQGTVQISIIYI